MTCLSLAPPRRPKEWKASWAYGHALPKTKTPTIFVPTQPVLSANAWEYNQISLIWSAPLVGAQPGDYYEVQISTDAGTTWEEWFRVLPYTDIQTGAIQTGADFAGFDPGKTYHFRVRPYRWLYPGPTEVRLNVIYGNFTNIANATTPNYVQSTPTTPGGQVWVINNITDWRFAMNLHPITNARQGYARVKWGDIVELSLSAADLALCAANSLDPTISHPGKWVTIRSAGYDTSGLKYDKRATLADKPKMATIWVDGSLHNQINAFGTFAGADYYTIEGVHFESRRSNINTGTLPNGGINLGSDGVGGTHIRDLPAYPTEASRIAALSSHIEFHRCVVDRTNNTMDCAEGVMLDGFFTVLKDSTVIGGSRANEAETHGIVYSTGDMVMVDNCYASAASIVAFMASPSGIPSMNNRGCVWKRSFFTREAEWKNLNYGQKNIWEAKREVDVIVSRCRGDWNRMGFDQRSSFLVTPRQTYEAGAKFSGALFEWMKLTDITRGVMISNDVSVGGGVLAPRNVVFSNCLIDEISAPVPGAPTSDSATWFAEITGDQTKDRAKDVRFIHCTLIDRDSTNQTATDSCTFYFEASSGNPQKLVDNFEFLYCMTEFLDEGITGAPFGSDQTGTTVINGFANTYSVTGNVFGGDSALNTAANYTGSAAGNAHESSATFRANFESYTTGDYRLKATSPHKGAAPGGKDKGADIAMLNAKTLHVVDGNWTEVLPTDIPNLEEWLDAGYQMFKDAGSTIAADGETVQQGVGRSSLALVSSQATSSKRPKLRAATLAVPSLEFTAANDTALLYPVNTLDLRTDDATWFYVFQYGQAVLSPAQYFLGNWPLGGKGYTVGVNSGKLRHTFVTNNTSYAGLDQANIEVTWGDVVIACVRWKSSTGKIRISVQRSDSDVLVSDVDQTVGALAGVDIDSVVQLAIGGNADQTTLDTNHRMMHFLFYRRELSDFECQTVANYCANDTNLVPRYFTIDRDSLNPLTYVPPANNRESYGPMPWRRSGEQFILCKGNTEVYLWKSPNDTSGFSLQNGNNPVITKALAGTEGANSVTHGAVAYDSANDTIHAYIKGFSASSVPSIIHFTASGATPTSWTKAGVVLTPSGFSPDSVIDIDIQSVLKSGSTWHFFGTRGMVGGNYRLWHGTSTGWNNTITVTHNYKWPHEASGNSLAWGSTVFRNPSSAGGYFMCFALGLNSGGDGERNLYMAYAPNLSVDEWQIVGTLLRHQTTGWETTRVHQCNILHQSTGDFDLPEVINGKWHMYYSGSNLTGNISTWTDLTGRLIMTPLL